MTTPAEGVDYSWGRPGAAALVAAGKTFALRYVDYPGAGGKGLTAPELLELHAYGIDVGLVFESTAERHLDGYNAGVADAQMVEASLANIGWPRNRPVYYAVDFDAQPSQYSLLDAYQQGVIDVMGDVLRVGIYGGFHVVKHVYEAGLAAWVWQALAWSGGNLYEYRHLYQYRNGQTINGAAVDYNWGYGDDFGVWKATDMDETLKLLNEALMKRFNIIEIAGGDYNRMLAAWAALVNAGIIQVQAAPPDNWPKVIAVAPS